MKFLRVSSVIILALAGLSLFGHAVRSLEQGKSVGILSRPISWLVEFPDLVLEVLQSNEIKGIPPTYIERKGGSDSAELNYAVYGLSPIFDFNSDRWQIKLFNFRNDEVVHEWFIEKETFLKTTDRKFENAEPRNPILLQDRHLIANNDETNNLYRLDAKSNIVWKNNSRYFHHSMNLGPDGNIWLCSTSDRFVVDNREGDSYRFRDDLVTQVDAGSGNIIFDKSVSEILIENGYTNFVYGFTNEVNGPKRSDPLHLNDVQPIISSGKHWKRGDLLLSLRHRSLIFLYRPSTNKIIRLIYGPFLNQHDVDVISESEISIFNNNHTDLGEKVDGETDPGQVTDSLISSQIIIYDFEDSTFRTYAQQVFEEHGIYTKTEGFHEFLSTGDVYVESQNEGRVFILNENRVVLEKTFETTIQDVIELPHWIRIYEDIDF